MRAGRLGAVGIALAFYGVIPVYAGNGLECERIGSCNMNQQETIFAFMDGFPSNGGEIPKTTMQAQGPLASANFAHELCEIYRRVIDTIYPRIDRDFCI